MASEDLKDPVEAQPSSGSMEESSTKQHVESEIPQQDSKPERRKTSTRKIPEPEGLADKKARLEETLALLQAQRSALVADAKSPYVLTVQDDWSDEERTKVALDTANGVVKEHIALLNKYNEIKDIGQGLMGLIADKRGVRIATVMEEYGMSEKD